ncbi:WbqC family protein [Hymenobacter psychrophilus]|uniref:WbqC-like protein family protein n=1 Tax=Hymenobacter psychrophilus TaxID=651662 RepID=A0A1H3H0C7_9BACT|nr:WbqC family protein [Hymenobacter psychrophilus]SDY08368.1 WbqC-like protein family protein [Hymenobacter psychrophilus]
MSDILFETQYHPPIAFFAEFVRADALWLEAHDHYRKQTYRNRCLILTAQGVKPLSVPVLDGNRSEKVLSSLIEIDYRQNWRHQHLHTLQTAYGGSPYFEYYADYLHDIYQQKPARLFDLNLALLHFYCRCLRLRLPIHLTTEYQPATAELAEPHDSAVSPHDLRDTLSPKHPTLPARPDRASVTVYGQHFGKDFAPGLSILDLLFMQGPAAGSFLA